MEEKLSTGIVIGRFQVPKLHPGHLYLIGEALQRFHYVTVLLGVSRTITDRDPYRTSQRVIMIKKVFPHVNVVAMLDKPTDEEWSTQVDSLASKYPNPVLIGSRDSFIAHYKGGLEYVHIEELPGFSGTAVRESIQR